MVMNKELEFIRKTVIMAYHPDVYCKIHSMLGGEHDRETCQDCYEDALQKELGFNCKLAYPSQGSQPKGLYTIITSKNPAANTWHTLDGYNYLPVDNDMKIIGRPITLARVLIAISKIDSIYVEIDDYGHIWQTTAANVHSRKKVTEWDLTKDIDERSPKETILAISKILGYEKQND